MPIQVNRNWGNPIFTPQLSTGRTGLADGETPPLVDLSDVNKVGLNDNQRKVVKKYNKHFNLNS